MGDFDRNIPKCKTSTKTIFVDYSEHNIEEFAKLYPEQFKIGINKYLHKNKNNMAKVILYPFEVIVIKRGGTDEEPTAEIVKPTEVVFSKDGKDIALRVAMELGKEHAKDADKIDILVRPFVNG